MPHVVQTPTAPFPIQGGAGTVHQVPAAKDNLVWLISCEETGALAAVDGPSAKEVLAATEALGRPLTHVLTTHTHHDHIGLHKDLARRGLLTALTVVGCGERAADIPGLNQPVDEGDVAWVGKLRADVWRTEGHLNGHLSYVFDGAVFCGDTVFAGGAGFAFDGPYDVFARSVWRLAGLPGHTKLCCAHEYTQDNLRFAWLLEPDNAALRARMQQVWALRSGGGCTVPSLIEEERATNPFLRPGSPELQASLRRLGRTFDGTDPVQVFEATRLLKNASPHTKGPTALTDADFAWCMPD